jgi:hypothetical protein
MKIVACQPGRVLTGLAGATLSTRPDLFLFGHDSQAWTAKAAIPTRTSNNYPTDTGCSSVAILSSILCIDIVGSTAASTA